MVREKNDTCSMYLFSALYVQSPDLDSREIGVQTGILMGATVHINQ